MDLLDIIKYNEKTNVKRLEKKSTAKEILTVLINSNFFNSYNIHNHLEYLESLKTPIVHEDPLYEDKLEYCNEIHLFDIILSYITYEYRSLEEWLNVPDELPDEAELSHLNYDVYKFDYLTNSLYDYLSNNGIEEPKYDEEDLKEIFFEWANNLKSRDFNNKDSVWIDESFDSVNIYDPNDPYLEWYMDSDYEFHDNFIEYKTYKEKHDWINSTGFYDKLLSLVKQDYNSLSEFKGSLINFRLFDTFKEDEYDLIKSFQTKTSNLEYRTALTWCLRYDVFKKLIEKILDDFDDYQSYLEWRELVIDNNDRTSPKYTYFIDIISEIRNLYTKTYTNGKRIYQDCQKYNFTISNQNSYLKQIFDKWYNENILTEQDFIRYKENRKELQFRNIINNEYLNKALKIIQNESKVIVNYDADDLLDIYNEWLLDLRDEDFKEIDEVTEDESINTSEEDIIILKLLRYLIRYYLYTKDNEDESNNEKHNIVDWNSDTYLEIFEDIYLIEGLLFYIHKYSDDEELILEFDKEQNDEEYKKSAPEKILRYFGIVYINNVNHKFNNKLSNLKNITKRFFINSKVNENKLVTAISNKIYNNNSGYRLHKLNGLTLDEIIQQANDRIHINDDRYFSSTEELYNDFDKIIYEFNKLVTSYINKNKLSEIFQDIDYTKLGSLDEVYIIGSNKLDINNIPKTINIPEENYIFSDIEKDKIIEYIQQNNE